MNVLKALKTSREAKRTIELNKLSQGKRELCVPSCGYSRIEWNLTPLQHHTAPHIDIS